MKSNGIDVYYNDLVELIAEFIDSHGEKMCFVLNENPKSISEVFHSEGALEYQKMKRLIEQKLGVKKDHYRLILVTIYLDEYQAYRKRKKETLGIYLSLGNMYLKYLGEETILNLSLVPSGVDLMEVLDQIIVKPVIERLELGAKLLLKNYDEPVHIMGSVNLVLGDNKGQALVAGLPSASSWFTRNLSGTMQNVFGTVQNLVRTNKVFIPKKLPSQ